jgi:antitoxin MazE
MRAKLVRIGNSRGLRLPKALLDQCGFADEVELDVENGRLVVTPVQAPRKGWDQAFAQMATSGDDRLVDAGQPPSDWDQAEWEW